MFYLFYFIYVFVCWFDRVYGERRLLNYEIFMILDVMLISCVFSYMSINCVDWIFVVFMNFILFVFLDDDCVEHWRF